MGVGIAGSDRESFDDLGKVFEGVFGGEIYFKEVGWHAGWRGCGVGSSESWIE